MAKQCDLAEQTQTADAYWLDGTPYCVDCVEGTPPCMSESERQRSIREPGIGCCGCCGQEF